MLSAFLLLLFGALQPRILPRVPKLIWAVVYFAILETVSITLLRENAPLLHTITLGFYAWGYLILLQKWYQRQQFIWASIYLIGAMLPLVVLYTVFTLSPS